MNIQYCNCLVLVNDICVSRDFYHNIMGLEISNEFDAYIKFTNGFAIHDAKLYHSYINRQVTDIRANYSAYYFTTADLQGFYERLKDNQVDMLHEIKEQEWGEKVIRFYDPDGHIIEVGDAI